MSKSRDKSRRDFIKLASASALVAGASIRVRASNTTILPSWQTAAETQKTSANDKIQLGLIGAGGQGMSDATTALRVPGVELVAVADVYDGRLVRSKEIWGEHVFTTRDYRELLARPDIDAVIIATPDHWHMQAAIDAKPHRIVPTYGIDMNVRRSQRQGPGYQIESRRHLVARRNLWSERFLGQFIRSHLIGIPLLLV